MPMTKFLGMSNYRQNSQLLANIILMVFLVVTIFFVMLFPATVQKALYQFCLSGILISATFCIYKKYRRHMIWVVAFVIVIQWMYIFTGNILLNGVTKSVTICLYIIIAIWLVKQAASSNTVTGVVILESVNGYLMIAMFYSVIIALVMLFDPRAFHFGIPVKSYDVMLTNFNEYLYYGFNAFTSVTYGDVLPVSQVAKSISMTIGFTGQMYVAIIIAMLVGKFTTEPGNNKK
jgi:voltage-gated potassium channel